MTPTEKNAVYDRIEDDASPDQRALPAPPERDELPLRPKHAIFDDTHIGLAVYALARPDFEPSINRLDHDGAVPSPKVLLG